MKIADRLDSPVGLVDGGGGMGASRRVGIKVAPFLRGKGSARV